MKTQRIYLLFILVCIVFGTTFLAISMGLAAGASPLLFAALRFTAAGGIMLSGLWALNRAPFRTVCALAGRATLLSLFLTVGDFGCIFLAQTRVDSGFMARLDATGPILTALFALMWLQKKIGAAHLAAFALGTAGAFLIAAPAARAESLYLFFAAGGVVFYAVGNVLYPRLFDETEDPVLISALQSLVGGLILMVVALITEEVRFPLAAAWPFIYLVIGGSIVGHTAALVLVRDAGPVFASGWQYVAPVIATAAGALVLDEPVTAGGILGTVLALSGMFVLGRAESCGQPDERPAGS